MPSFSLTVKGIEKGLRSSARSPRGVASKVRDNHGPFITCSGAVGRDGVLSAMDELTRMVTDTITDSFPYPQIFVFDRMIIVCSETKIYEWVASALVLKLTVTAGTTWRALQFSDFVYMSNGKVSVTRDHLSFEYEVSTHPVASALCNYNGQVIIGASGVEVV